MSALAAELTWYEIWGPTIVGAIFGGLVTGAVVLWLSARVEERVGKQLIEFEQEKEGEREKALERRRAEEQARAKLLPSCRSALARADFRWIGDLRAAAEDPLAVFLPAGTRIAIGRVVDLCAALEAARGDTAEAMEALPMGNIQRNWLFGIVSMEDEAVTEGSLGGGRDPAALALSAHESRVWWKQGYHPAHDPEGFSAFLDETGAEAVESARIVERKERRLRRQLDQAVASAAESVSRALEVPPL